MGTEYEESVGASGTAALSVAAVAEMPSTLAAAATASAVFGAEVVRAMPVRRLMAAGLTPDQVRFAQRFDTVVKEVYAEIAAAKARLSAGGL